MPLFGDSSPNVRITVCPCKTEFRFGAMRFTKRQVGNSVRYDLDLAGRHVMRQPEQLTAFLRHDDDLRRYIYDALHHIMLGRRWLGEHRMKGRDHRHVEPRQELDNVAARLPAKNSVFMLKGNNIEAGIVQERGPVHIFVDVLVLDRQAHGARVVVGTTRIRHRYDAGVQIGTRQRHRPMKIVGEGCNAAAARKMVADECYSFNRIH